MTASKELWIVVVAYIALSVIVGNIANRREQQKSASGYFHTQLPAIVVALSCTGTAISGVAFIGTPGTTYVQGIGLWAVNAFAGLLGVVLCNLILGKPLRRLNAVTGAITVTDLLVNIYQDNRLRYICVPCLLVISTVFTACQWQSIGTMLNTLLGINYIPAVLLGVAVVGLYSILGGNKSTAVVGAVQVGVAMLACIYLVYVALKVNSGGFAKLNADVAAVNPELLQMTNSHLSVGMVISYLLMYSVGTMGQPAILVKYFQLKDVKMLPKTLLAGTISMFVTMLVPIVALVMIVNVASGAIPDPAYSDAVVPTFITTYCGPYAGGLLVSACLAAIMSTGAALLVSASSTLVKDIMIDWLHVDCEGKKGVRYSRLSTLIIMVVSTLIACFPVSGILQIGFAAFGAFGAVFAPAVTLGLRWRRATKQGALAGMWTAFILVAGVTLLGTVGIWKWPFDLHVSVVAIALSTLVNILVSLATPPQEKPFMPPTRAEIRALLTQKRGETA